MKFLLSVFLLLSPIVSLHAQTAAAGYEPTASNLAARQQFSDARFGIFLHWGLYSLFAQGEWYMQNEGIDKDEYAKAMNAFYPHAFNAREWIETFRQAGAKYICFTSRHHEGFSMWNTQCSPYNIMHTPYAHDIVGELAEACHEAGMGLHLYYSHIDWTREDYPMGRTGRRTGKDPQRADWPAYYAFMNAQLTELLTNYGKINGIWFDGVWDHDNDSIPFDWQLPEQYRLIHSLQPACLVGNNHHQTPVEGEDMQMFERDVPGENKAGLSGQAISRLPLETCETMNGMWGYKIKDQNYKSTPTLLRLLVRTAAKGANLLLNIGPQPDGQLPATALQRLREMGTWLHGPAGESIYATVAGPIAQGDSLVSTQGRTTGAVYLHLLSSRLPATLNVPLPERPAKVEALLEGKPLPFVYSKKEKRLSVQLPQGEKVEVDYIVKITPQNRKR